MDLRFSRQAAADSLARAAYDPRRLTLLHTGVSLAVSLVLTLLNFLLSRGIDETGGLAGMGDRAILGTLQSIVSLVGTVALPFWSFGFPFAALIWADNRTAKPRDLLEGFRRLRPLMRLLLLSFLWVFGVVFACLEVSSILFSLTPFYQSNLTAMQSVLEQAMASGVTTLDEAVVMELMPMLMPVYGIFLILLLVVGIPLFYRFRMSTFAILDDAPGARKAMGISNRMMKGNRLALFRLDLSFWWYYLGLALISVTAYLDVLLPALKIRLPISQDLLFWGVFGLNFVLQLLFAYAFNARVQTAYAHCYRALKAAMPPPPQPMMPPQYGNWNNQNPPQNTPWNNQFPPQNGQQ